VKRDADVLVVGLGLGAMGSMALWQLAARGVKVMGVDQFEPGHPWGSSHGATRLFRTACFEHPSLAPMAMRARELWEELGDRADTELVRVTGAIMIGPRDSQLITGTQAASEAIGLRLDVMDQREVSDRFPQHTALDPSHVGMWDPLAGVVRAEAGVCAAVAAAQELGAVLHVGQRVTEVRETADGVLARVGDHELSAGHVVVSAGPWLGKLVPGIPVQPIRVVMTWYEAREDPAAFELDRFPVFIRHIDSDRTMWGHGATDGKPAKIGAPDDPSNFTPADPDALDRVITPEQTALGSQVLSRLVAGLNSVPVESRACMVTFSADGQFLLGPLSADSRIILAGGCSGHAFKHAPAIGELLADLATGRRPRVNASFVDPARFETSAVATPTSFIDMTRP
jgi:sarcosine oxidase